MKNKFLTGEIFGVLLGMIGLWAPDWYLSTKLLDLVLAKWLFLATAIAAAIFLITSNKRIEFTTRWTVDASAFKSGALLGLGLFSLIQWKTYESGYGLWLCFLCIMFSATLMFISYCMNELHSTVKITKA